MHHVVVAAGQVTTLDPLDLDDAGTEIGEVARGQRSRDRLLERDDGDAFQGQHQDAFFAARTSPPPMIRRWISLVPS